MGKHVHIEPAPFPLGELLSREITRSEAEALIAALIEGLDGLDPDPDLEADVDADPVADDLNGELDKADDEPSLGAPERHPYPHATLSGAMGHDQTYWAQGHGSCEEEDDDREPDVDGEPALGWTNYINQDRFLRTKGLLNHAHEEDEPSLGAALNHSNQLGWGQGSTDEREAVNEDGGDTDLEMAGEDFIPGGQGA